MSFCGHVLCQRIEIGPWALATIGKPSVAAPVAARAAPRRKVRRGVSVTVCESLMEYLLLIDGVKCSAGADGSRGQNTGSLRGRTTASKLCERCRTCQQRSTCRAHGARSVTDRRLP